MASETARKLQIGEELPTFVRHVSEDKMVEFEHVVWNRGSNSHSDPEAAKKDGLARPLASGQNQMAFLHELLEHNFGDNWVYGGSISVRYIHPVYGGDRITPHAVVRAIVGDGARQHVELDVWCENQDGIKTAAGRVTTAGLPSTSCSWLDQTTSEEGTR